jgi:NADH-quinone oxidoreductase subunit F
MNYQQLKQKAADENERLTGRPIVYVNTATCARSAGAAALHAQLQKESAEGNNDHTIIETGCMGNCHAEPLLMVQKPDSPRMVYSKVTLPEIKGIIDGIKSDNGPRFKELYGTIGQQKLPDIPEVMNTAYFAAQTRNVLRNCGIIDPNNILDYVRSGGYWALEKALMMPPEDVIKKVTECGLRGRGGCSIPSGAKWQACLDAAGRQKYMICNASEFGAAYSTRLLLESDPHAILEGILIGAYAIGAENGLVCINARNQLAIQRIKLALHQMQDSGLLGKGILGHDFGFNVDVRIISDDFISGEETALLRGLAGERAMPYARPSLSYVLELNGIPSCVNSAETLANIPIALQDDAIKIRNTRLITLTGAVPYSGVIETPSESSLKQVIETGGGTSSQRSFKAVLAGGPFGAILPESKLDLPIAYEDFQEEGILPINGEVRVLDDRICVVNLAKECLALTHKESCGKCVTCREGTYQLHRILMDFTEGKAKREDLDLLDEICSVMKETGICGFGRAATAPVSSSLKYFREEYEMHGSRKRCQALACNKLVSFHILGEKCKGCGKCYPVCPQGAIEGEIGYIHVIDQDECTHCGLCLEACPAEYSAIIKAGLIKPKTPAEPIPVGTWKKR